MIPLGGLEVSLLLKFESQVKSVTDKIVANDEDEEEIDFETLDIENSNENDEIER